MELIYDGCAIRCRVGGVTRVCGVDECSRTCVLEGVTREYASSVAAFVEGVASAAGRVGLGGHHSVRIGMGQSGSSSGFFGRGVCSACSDEEFSLRAGHERALLDQAGGGLECGSGVGGGQALCSLSSGGEGANVCAADFGVDGSRPSLESCDVGEFASVDRKEAARRGGDGSTESVDGMLSDGSASHQTDGGGHVSSTVGGASEMVGMASEVGAVGGGSCSPPSVGSVLVGVRGCRDQGHAVDASTAGLAVKRGPNGGISYGRGKKYQKNQDARDRKKFVKAFSRTFEKEIGSDSFEKTAQVSVEKTDLQKSSESKWQAQNRLAALKAEREIAILEATDLDEEKRKRRAQICAATERNLVSIEKFHSDLKKSGNTSSDDDTRVNTIFSGSAGSISPSSSISEADVRRAKKEMEDAIAREKKAVEEKKNS